MPNENGPRIIACRQPGKNPNRPWRFIASKGLMVLESGRAERLGFNEAGRRVLQYLNDYPGWEFRELDMERPETWEL